jgi:predicted ATPase
MVMDINSIREVFTSQRYIRTRETAKLDEYQAPINGQCLYHNKDQETIQIVIDPGLSLDSFLELPGVTCPTPDKLMKDARLRQFPEWGGTTLMLHHGRVLSVASPEALAHFLKVFDTPAGGARAGDDLPPRLTAIELENFKGVGGRIRVELAPITLLFGANSAGKSTILQALQYMREVLERRNANPDRTIHGGEFVDLGGFRNLVHQRDPTRAISIKLEIELNRASLPDLVPDAFDEWQTSDDSVWEFSNLLQETKERTKSVSIELKIGWSSVRQAALVIGYEAGLNGEWLVRIESGEDGRDAGIKINSKNPVLMRYRTQDQIDLDRELLADIEPDAGINSDDEIDDSSNHAYSLWPGIKYALNEVEIKGAAQGFRQWLTTVEGALPKLEPLLYVPTGEARGTDAVYIAREFTSFLSTVVVGPGVLIRNQLRKLRYVGPIRNVPPRDFEASLTPDEARWADGTAAWEKLLTGDASLVDEVSAWMANEDRLATGYEVERHALKEIDVRTLNWLIRAADPDAGVRSDPELLRQLEMTPEKQRLDLIDTKTGMHVQPRDVGIGISQVLPVVVAVLEPSASLVAIEQPELHIHPAVQVGLGDLLIKGAKEKGISFLIETHSEHLILRLLRRIRETAEGELPPGAITLKPDDVCVVYVQPGEGGVKLVPLPIDETGEFTTRWPKGFFDERAEELF